MDARMDDGDCLVPDADMLRWPPPQAYLEGASSTAAGVDPESEFPDMSLHYRIFDEVAESFGRAATRPELHRGAVSRGAAI